MILTYRILTKLIYPFLLILIFLRILLKKEDSSRYKEKIFVSHFNIRKKRKKLIWFHAASIGELRSIVPIIQKLNSDALSLEFLITTTTLSSSKIANKEFERYKNINHRFFPFDIDFLMERFLKLLKPDYIFFVDSDIWPNLIFKAKENNIPLAIINARITSKTFKRWMVFPKTAYKVFNCFDLCLASSAETKFFLKKLKVKKVNYNGNIKFIDTISENNILNQNKSILLKNKFWVAASTHRGEEELCLKTHLILKEKYHNVLTVIAPRHIERSKEIKSLCKKYSLATQILNHNELISQNQEVIILNSFGVLKNYFKYAKSVFVGKSTIKKLESSAGQNPLEAVKEKCKIYHGPYVYNFKDIYEILKKNNVAFKIKNHNQLSKFVSKDLESFDKKDDKIINLINDLGNKILTSTLKDIKKFISNETK